MKEELLRPWRAGDKCRVMGMIAIIIFKEGNLYHLRTEENDSDLSLPHRIFQENELEQL